MLIRHALAKGDPMTENVTLSIFRFKQSEPGVRKTGPMPRLDLLEGKQAAFPSMINKEKKMNFHDTSAETISPFQRVAR